MRDENFDILLIDDDRTSNILHRRIIRKIDPNLKLRDCTNGEEAMQILQSAFDQGLPAPQLIFVDLNMPVCDGWCFADSFGTLAESWRLHSRLYILTTSLNPEDQERTIAHPLFAGIFDKGCSTESIRSLFEDSH